jgi:hypothetical protein
MTRLQKGHEFTISVFINVWHPALKLDLIFMPASSPFSEQGPSGLKEQKLGCELK